MKRRVLWGLTPWLMTASLALPCGSAHAIDLAEARIRMLSRRITEHPDDKELYARRGVALCEQGSATEGKADLAQAARLDATWPGLKLARARCALLDGQLEQARDDIASYRAHEPDDLEGLHVEAQVLFRLGMYAEAEQRYVQYLGQAERPRLEDYLEASEACEQQGTDHFERASRIVGWGMSKVGDLPALREKLIRLALEGGDPEGALLRIEEAMKSKRKGPREDERWFALRGEVLSHLGRHDQARAAYRQSLTAIDRQSAARRSEPAMVSLRERVEAALMRLDRDAH